MNVVSKKSCFVLFVSLAVLSGITMNTYAKGYEGTNPFDPTTVQFFEYRDNHKKFKKLRDELVVQFQESNDLLNDIEKELTNKRTIRTKKFISSNDHLKTKARELVNLRKNLLKYSGEDNGRSFKGINERLDWLARDIEEISTTSSNGKKIEKVKSLKAKLKNLSEIKLRPVQNLRSPDRPGGMTNTATPKPVDMGSGDFVETNTVFSSTSSDSSSYIADRFSAVKSFFKSKFGLIDEVNANAGYLQPDLNSNVASCYATHGEYASNISKDLDLTQPEIEVSSDLDPSAHQKITELAASLDYSPIKILEYVTNELEHQHYLGSVKGAFGALQSRGGNDVDHASLLIALLRASSVPARYVKANIYIQDKEEHLDWWGVKDIEAAQSAVLNASHSATHISYTIDGKRSFAKEHVWVEACVPYADYRGSEGSKESYRWVPMDASFKSYKRYDGLDVSVDFDYEDFLSTRTKKLPVEVFQDQLLAEARMIDSNASLNDVGVRWEQEKIKLEFLPDSLPYKLRGYQNWNPEIASPVTASLPEDWRAHVRMFFAGSESFDIPTTDFAQHRITLSFEGASDSENATYQQFLTGNTELNCQSNNIQVKPIFKKDGDASIYPNDTLASVSICNGDQYRKINLGVAVRIQNKVVSTTEPNKSAIYFDTISPIDYYALSAYIFQDSPEYFEERKAKLFQALANTSQPSDNLDETLGEFLHLVVTNYMSYITKSNSEIGRLHNSTGRSGHHVGLASTRADIEYLFDLPYAMQSNNFVVDVPGGKSISRKIEGDENNAAEVRLSGYTASHLESYVWQEFALKDAVSTVAGLQIASESDNEVRSFTSADGLRGFINVCTDQPDTSKWPRSTKLSDMVKAFRAAGLHEGYNDGLKDYFYANINYFTSYSSRSQVDRELDKSFVDCYYSGLVNSIYSKSFPSGFANKVTISKYPVRYNGWMGPVYVVENIKDGNMRFGFPISSFSGGYTVPTIAPSVYKPPASSASSYSTGFDIPKQVSTVTPDFNSNSVSTVNSGVGDGVSTFGTVAFDPVNMVTGNMYHEETDISVPTRGLPFVFKRTYNSRTPEQGPLGWGWTHSLNQSLKFEDTDGKNGVDTIVWTNGSGSKKYISLASSIGSSGGYLNITEDKVTIPDGFYFNLSRPYTGGTVPEIEITEKNGMVYYFQPVRGANGDVAKLVGITDRNNNAINLNYVANRLDTVSDEDNRTISFDYYPNTDLIHTITLDWANVTHEYFYEDGHLTSYRNPLDRTKGIDSSVYEYYSEADGGNLNHRMRSFAYANGYQMTFEYYVNGKAYRHYNAEGETVVFSYNDFRREATTIDEQGRVQNYIFNKDGLPQEITDPLGGKETYFYEDPNDPMLRTKTIDAMGYETLYRYDTNGNLVETTLPSGDSVSYYYYNRYGQPQKIKNALGDYSIRLYDFRGNLTDSINFKKGFGAAINPNVFNPTTYSQNILKWTKNSYDANGKLELVRQVKDFSNAYSGPSTEFDFTDSVNGTEGIVPVEVTFNGDVNGDGIIAADEGLGSFTTEYDAQSRQVAGFDERLYQTTTKYDLAGRILKASAPYGGDYYFTYDDSGLLASKKLIAKSGTALKVEDSSVNEYDTVNRLIKKVDASGAVSRFEYDDSGNMIKSTSPDGYNIYFEYDDNNRVKLAHDEEGNTVTRELDLIGRIKRLIDPNGNATEYEYYGPEENGRLKRVTDAEGRWTEFEYNAAGQVERVIDNVGRETLSSYDALGRVIRVVSPAYTDILLGTVRPITKYVYNTLGHQTHVYAGYTNAAADLIADNALLQAEYQYDDFGRLLKKYDAERKEWTNTYDFHGNLKTSKDANGYNTTFYYNTVGLLYRKYSAGSPTGSETTTYSYNALGQPLTTNSKYIRYSYQYDAAHRLKRVSNNVGGGYIDYDYSIGGMLNSIQDARGNKTSYLYDPVGRLTGIRTPDKKLISYVYDAAGRLQQKVFPNDLVTSYDYFNDNRVKSISTTDSSGSEILSHQYTYNDGGETETAIHNISGVTDAYRYAYDDLGRLTRTTEASNDSLIEQIDYDQFGNRRRKVAGGQTHVYSHNALHQIEAIRQNNSSGPIVADFEYDDNGNMVRKTYQGVNTLITHDSLNRVVKVIKDGLAEEKYTYDHGIRRITKTVGTAKTRYQYAGPDIFSEFVGSSTIPSALYSHGASMDDPIWRKQAANDPEFYHADGLGSVVAMSNASGSLTATNRYDAWGNVKASTGTTPQYGFTGREPNANGLVYFRARFYDPEIARFTQQDPKGFIDGVNQYAYVMNSPVNYVDPWGTTASKPTIVADSGGYADPHYIDPLSQGLVSPIDSAVQFFTEDVIQGVSNVINSDYSGAVMSAIMAVAKPAKAVDNILDSVNQDMTTLYRAVMPDELADIQTTGQIINRGSAEGKYFTTSSEHASDYAKQAVNAFNDPPYTTIKTQVPTSSLPSPVSVDGGIPAYVIPDKDLGGLKPEIMNSMAVPK